MYGVVNKVVEDLEVSSYGVEKWEAKNAKAGVDVSVFKSNGLYPDEITYKRVGPACDVLDASPGDLPIAFGEHWVLNTRLGHYGARMRSGGNMLSEFLVNLAYLYTRVQLIYPKLVPPEFECSDVREHSLRLHYFAHRPGLSDFVVGLVQGLGQLYDTPAAATLVESKSTGANHDAPGVKWAAAAGHGGHGN